MLEFISSLPPSLDLVSLCLLSFLAATLLPLGSEWFLLVLLHKGEYSPALLVVLATIFNSLGGYTNYIIGRFGSSYCIQKILRMDEKDIGRATRFYSRWGIWSLLFSWLPVIGDGLCLVAGIMKAHQGIFALLVLLGKLARYTAITIFFLRG